MKRRTAMGKNRISNRGSDRNGDRNGGSNGGSGNSGARAGNTTLLTREIFSFLSTNITTEFHFDTNENSGLWSTSTSFFGTGTPNSLDVGIQLDLSGPVIPLDYATGFSGYLPKGVLGSL